MLLENFWKAFDTRSRQGYELSLGFGHLLKWRSWELFLIQAPLFYEHADSQARGHDQGGELVCWLGDALRIAVDVAIC